MISRVLSFYLSFFILMWAPRGLASAVELVVGQSAPLIKLAGKQGGRVTGEPWSSEEIKGKIFSVFYVDPEEKALNAPLEAAYKREDFPPDKHQGVAIINLAAAWYPDSIIDGMLKDKQKEFPRTIYVRDVNKEVLKVWELKDSSVNVVIFNKYGKILFVKKGPVTATEIPQVMKIIHDNM